MHEDDVDRIPAMTAAAADRDLEAQIKALRREVAGLYLALKSVGHDWTS